MCVHVSAFSKLPLKQKRKQSPFEVGHVTVDIAQFAAQQKIFVSDFHAVGDFHADRRDG